MADSSYSRKEQKKFWGVCDGESIYINEQNYEGNFIFKKILELGRYCSLKALAYSKIPIAAIPVGPAGPSTIVSVPVKHVEPCVLNINNGKFYILTKSILRTILEKDAELLDLYKMEIENGDDLTMLSYIKKYNMKHEDEAIVNNIPIDIFLYRLAKKKNILHQL